MNFQEVEVSHCPEGFKLVCLNMHVNGHSFSYNLQSELGFKLQ